MKTFNVEVVLSIDVTLDETKFDQSFYDEYNRTIGFLGDTEDQDDALKQHAMNLAQLEARGVLREDFIEGYGRPEKMGIAVEEGEIVQIDVMSDKTLVE